MKLNCLLSYLNYFKFILSQNFLAKIHRKSLIYTIELIIIKNTSYINIYKIIIYTILKYKNNKIITEHLINII